MRPLLAVAVFVAVLGLGDTRTVAAVEGLADLLESVGPLLIRDQQDVVTQHVRVANPYGPCITVQGSTNVVIRKSVVGPYGDIAIRSYGNENVTISRVLVHDAAAHGVLIRLSTDVKVRESHFERVRTGVGAISSSGISVTCPQFLYQGLR